MLDKLKELLDEIAWKNSRTYRRAVMRARVLRSDPKPPMLCLHHVDGNPRNNHPSNLRVVTMPENR